MPIENDYNFEDEHYDEDEGSIPDYFGDVFQINPYSQRTAVDLMAMASQMHDPQTEQMLGIHSEEEIEQHQQYVANQLANYFAKLEKMVDGDKDKLLTAYEGLIMKLLWDLHVRTWTIGEVATELSQSKVKEVGAVGTLFGKLFGKK